MTNPTPREIQLVEAALKAAAREVEAFSIGPLSRLCCAANIRSLDPAAIVASVPQPSEQPDQRKKWQALDHSFNADRAGLHTFHVDAFDAGLEWAAEWHRLVVSLGCLFDFDTSCSAEEIGKAAAAKRDALAKSKKTVDQENARFAIEGAIEYGRRNINPPPSDDHWLAPFWNIGRQLGAPQERTEDERARFEYVERASNLKRDDCGDYENPCVQSAWEGWQAAKRDALTQAPQRVAATDAEILQAFSNAVGVSIFDEGTEHIEVTADEVIAATRALLSANQGK